MFESKHSIAIKATLHIDAFFVHSEQGEEREGGREGGRASKLYTLYLGSRQVAAR